MNGTPTPDEQPPLGIDPSAPHSARIWNYWLGGNDCHPADRAMGDQIMQFFPEIVENARGNRQF